MEIPKNQIVEEPFLTHLITTMESNGEDPMGAIVFIGDIAVRREYADNNEL